MTDEEFDKAERGHQRAISWIIMLFTAPWFAVFIGVRIHWRDWFNHHQNVDLVVLGLAVGGFLTAAVLISRRLRARHRLICRTCGRSGMLSPTGECYICYPPRRLLRRWWPLLVAQALVLGVFGVAENADARRGTGDGGPWGVLAVTGCVGVIAALAWRARVLVERKRSD
jgi:hypothetical protein